MRYSFTIDDEPIELELTEQTPERFTVRAGERTLDAVVLGTHPTLAVAIDGRVVELLPLSATSASARGDSRVISATDPRRRTSTGNAGIATSALELRAPMPGRIVKVLVSPGQVVEPKTAALVMEAMKMENELSLPRGGTVRSVHVSAGAAVERGALLVVVD